MKILSQTTRPDVSQWYESAQSDGAALLIDKEVSWTSFDVVARLRSLLKVSKVGHAGTLDPRATGLLIVCCGKATKRIEEFQNLSKEYETIIKLGATTETYDAEAAEENLQDVSSIDEADIRRVASSLIGEIEQIPPMYSARKVGGRRLYQLARKGQTVERGASKVHIHELDITNISLPFVSLRVVCSKGTYIRTLAHDIGQMLGCGGYMYELRRTAIGDFRVSEALHVNEVVSIVSEMRLQASSLGEIEKERLDGTHASQTSESVHLSEQSSQEKV